MASILDAFKSEYATQTGKDNTTVDAEVESEVDVDEDGGGFGFHLSGENGGDMLAALGSMFAQMQQNEDYETNLRRLGSLPDGELERRVHEMFEESEKMNDILIDEDENN